MRRLLQVCALALVALATPWTASAQQALADDDRAGLVSAGAMVGAQLDTDDNWLLFGGDLRVQVAHALEFQPRFTYQPEDGGHTIQMDANILRNFDLARPGRFRPFMGIGGTLRKVSPDVGTGETKLGLNLVSGARVALSSSRGYEPFIIGQYTIIPDYFNSFSIVVGASFRLRQ
ncbi:MAG: hypothetical protein AB7H96_00755 [Vicinamibacterales bacterium]